MGQSAEVQYLQASSEQGQSMWARGVVQVLRGLLVLMACGYVVMYIRLACLRMPYPYELEWMEGGIVDQVRWVLSGRSLYVAPSLEFIPNIYGPLYTYASAAVCKVVGVGFLGPRLISFVSSLGCLWLIGSLVRRETGSRVWGFVAAGVFAASYRMTGAWMDIARVDSLFLVLALSAVYLVRLRPETAWQATAGVLMGLSFLTKQTGLFIGLPLAGYALLAYRGRARYAFAGAFLGLVLATTLLLDRSSRGWYSYYLFHLPGLHRTVPIMWPGFWVADIGKNMGVALAMTMFAMALGMGRRDIGFYGVLLAGMLGSSWMSRLHIGGYDNVLMPAAAALAIGLGVGGAAFQSVFGRASGNPGRFGLGGRAGPLAAVYLVGIWQLVILAYLPGMQVPSGRDRRSGDAMVKQLAGLEGDVFMVEHGYLATLAGHKGFHAHGSALWDIVQTESDLGHRLREEFRRAIVDRKFEVLVLDAAHPSEAANLQQAARQVGMDPRGLARQTMLDLCKGEIEANYVRIGQLFERDDVFWPVTGMLVRPDRVYVPKDSPLAKRVLRGY